MVVGIEAANFNINLRFSEEVEERIITFANEITKAYNFTNYINFTSCVPHITLYLTQFEESAMPRLIESLTNSLKSLRGCSVNMKEIYASGSYFMWRSENSDCLQQLSNRIVEFTSTHRDKNYVVPEWVYQLEDVEERNKKIFFCEKFGSPNVFDGFDPHFTLIYTDSPDVDLVQIADDINTGKVNIPIPTFNDLQSTKVSLTLSGDYGTVIRSEVRTWIHLYDPVIPFDSTTDEL